MKRNTNLLGEIQAERDFLMLERAYFQTPDYDAIVHSDNKVVVIGRRGTGKSALTYKLEQTLKTSADTDVVKLVPDDDQMIAARASLNKYGEKFNYTQISARLAWKAVLLLHTLKSFSVHYKFNHLRQASPIKSYLSQWIQPNQNVALLFRKLLDAGAQSGKSSEEMIGDLADALAIPKLVGWVVEVSQEISLKTYMLIDKLDEGYAPDDVGIATVAGIIQATVEVNNSYPTIQPILFIRDNIFRAVSTKDDNYSRNIEGSEIRLRWDKEQLLTMVARRLHVAFEFNDEKPMQSWNRVTSRELSGNEGFERCLRLTLYRPRDLLGLLNEAFFQASRAGRSQIIGTDIEVTAKTISENRLNELHKEYVTVFPSIELFTRSFAGANQEITLADARGKVLSVLETESEDPRIQQDLLILDNEDQCLHALYSVGFIGVNEETGSGYKYCHDGRTTDLQLVDGATMMVHPCYWMALGISRHGIEPELAKEIHDDQELDLRAYEPAARRKILGRLISRIRNISEGQDDARAFEEWCLDSLRLLFASSLTEIQLHPNKDSTQQRDIVATNPAKTKLWKRVFDDYQTRQIIFEVKNYTELSGADYRQLAAYLNDTYGRLGFIISRRQAKEPTADRDLRWAREMYNTQGKKLIVSLSFNSIIEYLSKIRNPKKYDHVEDSMSLLLTTYHRYYLNEPVKR